MKKLEVTIESSTTLKCVILVPDKTTARELEKKLGDLSLNWDSFERHADLSTDVSVKKASADDAVDRSLGDFIERYFD